jgi:hypothetical protein
VHALAVLPDGTLYIGGWFWGTLDFGGEEITSIGSTHDVFVVKLDPAGNAIWSKRFGDEIDQDLQGLAADADGGVAFTGTLNGAIDFGGGTLTSLGVDDAYVAHLDPEGRYIASQRIGDDDNQEGRAIAVSTGNQIVAVGDFIGDLDSRDDIQNTGKRDSYLVRLASGGDRLWTKALGNGAEVSATGVAVGLDGSIVVAGQFRGTVNFGAGDLVSAGEEDIFVAYFDGAGHIVSSRRFGGAAVDETYAIALDRTTGKLGLTGFVTDQVDFGCGTLTRGLVDAFVAVLTPDGEFAFSLGFGEGESPQIGRAVAFDADHNVVVVGSFAGSLGLGEMPPRSTGREDAFVVKLHPDGSVASIRVLGGDGMQIAAAVGADASGNVFVAGYFSSWLDFDMRHVPSRGERDAFWVKLAP